MSVRQVGLIALLLFWSAQADAAIVKAPKQQAAANSASNPPPDPRWQKPKFVPVPAPSSHYATASRQAWTL